MSMEITAKDITAFVIWGVSIIFVVCILVQHRVDRRLMRRRSVKVVIEQNEVTPTLPRFRINEVVIHLKTQGKYTIVGLPTEYVLEHSREPAYAYRMKDGRICVRCQKEMEDGRFISDVWLPNNRRHEDIPVIDERRLPRRPLS